MKIILIQDLKNIGRKGELHEVKDGYARNFLIAKGLAKPATPEHLAKYFQAQERQQAQEQKNLETAQTHKTILEAKPMQVFLKTGENNQVFDSVNKQRIKEYCASFGLEIRQDDIDLDRPLKQPGEYEINLRLGRGIVARLKVVVSLAQ
jgi:large subunit ribosomal protein L9